MKLDESIITGTYQAVRNDALRFNLDGLVGEFPSSFGVNTCEYSISGDTMNLTIAGDTTTYKRMPQ